MAYGKVLITGLGFGFLLNTLINKKEVKKRAGYIDDLLSISGSQTINGGLSVFNHTVINNSLSIGTNVKIGNNCKIQNHSLIYEGVIIEDNVWIGSNCVILKNVTIRSGAVIGAGVTVYRNVGKNEIIVNPNKTLIK